MIIDQLQAKKEEIAKAYSIKHLSLFGSFAKNKANNKSDLDFLLELKPNVDDIFTVKNRLKEYLKNIFQREIDLANPKYLKSFVKDEILKEKIDII